MVPVATGQVLAGKACEAASSGVVFSDGRLAQMAVIGRRGVVGGLAALDDSSPMQSLQIHVAATPSGIGLIQLREAAARQSLVSSAQV